ncbi:uncharacterized protein FIBRA_01681 [Fibroporia radiculosa]|uniref:CRAL-TRIO domain-containing protein n=1 Tax=Fibroporia radiculosa TaxID=599839 RepID=J4I8M3_9APHY|nr:uncharacterized protein FIBRA_01681 [Fibroporia radiculosa]CCL99661.1 predicted protein [Fibroporia radiculosa]
MSIYHLLQSHDKHLVDLYENHFQTVLELQSSVLENVLPDLVQEHSLSSDNEASARQWLEDTRQFLFILSVIFASKATPESMFRVLKRHDFVVPYAIESIRIQLLWRMNVLPQSAIRSPSFIRCLPVNARDPSGQRPVVFLRLSGISEISVDSRDILVGCMELLRLHLQRLNSLCDVEQIPARQPILQYIAIVDMEGVSYKNLGQIDLIRWFIHEVIPKFPGMLAAGTSKFLRLPDAPEFTAIQVVILNYSWAQSSMWSIVKRVNVVTVSVLAADDVTISRRMLPSSVLSRVLFPSRAGLLEYFPPEALPSDWGGLLPSIAELDDPLRRPSSPHLHNQESGSTSATESHPSVCLKPDSPLAPVIRPSQSATAAWNPFYGYPVSHASSVPTLLHGRRRKRDLLRTLVRLLWARWGNHILRGLFLLAALLFYRIASSPRRWLWSARRGTGTSIYLPFLRRVPSDSVQATVFGRDVRSRHIMDHPLSDMIHAMLTLLLRPCTHCRLRNALLFLSVAGVLRMGGRTLFQSDIQGPKVLGTGGTWD